MSFRSYGGSKTHLFMKIIPVENFRLANRPPHLELGLQQHTITCQPSKIVFLPKNDENMFPNNVRPKMTKKFFHPHRVERRRRGGGGVTGLPKS